MSSEAYDYRLCSMYNIEDQWQRTSDMPSACGVNSLIDLTGAGSPPSVVNVDRRSMIYGVHNISNWVYFVDRGYVKTLAPSRDGKECLLGIYTRGDLIGDLYFEQDCVDEFAVAMTSCRLLKFPSGLLKANLKNPEYRADFMRYLSRRIFDQKNMIVDFVTANSEYRFGAVLMRLSSRIGQPRGDAFHIRLHITHEEFAAIVGTTRSRIGHFLHNFEQCAAVIKQPGGGLIVRRKVLTDYLDSIA